MGAVQKCAAIFALLCQSSFALCQVADRRSDPLCDVIQKKESSRPARQIAVLYIGSSNKTLQYFETAKLSDLRGAFITFRYFAYYPKRSNIPAAVYQSALNFKIEQRLWNSENSQVGLYNNHQLVAQRYVGCASEGFNSYQAFHASDNVIDTCLKNGFHNPTSDPFQTVQPLARRQKFLFPGANNSGFAVIAAKIASLFSSGNSENRSSSENIRRDSWIINFKTTEGIGSCLPISMSIDRAASEIDVVTDDLGPPSLLEPIHNSWGPLK
jgi:hypothetical protein